MPDTAEPDRGDPSNADIRAWCLTNGVPVAARGAIPRQARTAYDAAHGTDAADRQ